MTRLDDSALDQLFRTARTRNGWSAQPVGESTIRELYELLKHGPTAANSCPARFAWVCSEEGKARLASLATGSNGPKIRQAPVTVIVGYDLDFARKMSKLLPHAPQLAALFESNPALAQTTAFRNGSLQGGYLIMAARSLGLDCGPMSGFDNSAVDAVFFPDGRTRSNFLCSIGYGTQEGLFQRNPRLGFEEANRIV